MTQNRSSSRHNRRRAAGLLLSVAALAIAFSVGPGGYRHVNTGSPRIEIALGRGGFSGGHGGGFGHRHGRNGGAVSQSGTTQHQAYGPGEGNDISDWGGFMPNGEDGLMTLADFVHGHDGGNNPNQGAQHGWDGAGGSPDGPSGQVGAGGPPGGGGGGGFGPDGPTGPGDVDGVKGCTLDCSGGGWPNTDPPSVEQPVNSAVPEPAIWMMLTLGFGVLGSALRVQRRKGPRVLA